MKRQIFILVAMVFFGLSTYGQGVIYVDSSISTSGTGLTWATAKKTITQGIAASAKSDTIKIAKGIYFEDTTLIVPHELFIYGGYPTGGGTTQDTTTNRTIIDGDSAHGVISKEGAFNLTVNHLIIQRGKAVNGGGISNMEGGVLTIEHCVIRNNTLFFPSLYPATYRGGGVYSYSSDSSLANSTIVIRNSTVRNNKISSDYWGARGGGVHSYSEKATSTVTITNSNVNNNAANSSNNPAFGGGVFSYSPTLSVVAITNSYLNNNSASSDNWGVGGGGIFSNTGSSNSAASLLTITNSNINNNTALCKNLNSIARGGGINSFSPSSNVTVINSMLNNNATTATVNNINGGGIYSEGTASSINITNSIFANNTGGTTPNYYNNKTTNAINYSYFSGVDLSSIGKGNFDGTTVSPRFVNSSGGDYRLKPSSPLIDAGFKDSIPADIYDVDKDNDTTEQNPLDLDGNDRVKFGRVDIGAYESIVRDPQSIYVDSSVLSSGAGYTWATAKKTIKEAINISYSGDFIKIAKGTYKEDSTLIIPHTLLVYGGYPTGGGTSQNTGTNRTIIDGKSTHGVISKDGNFNLTLNTVIIQNGNAVNGGGVSNTNGSVLAIDRSIIRDNTASDLGGGVYSSSSSSVIISSSNVNNNTAAIAGGGVYSSSSVIVTASVVSDNTALDGGGIYASSFVTLTSSSVIDNAATSFGGGLYSGSTVSVTKSSVNNNTATYGGGVYCSSVNITNSNLTKNAASASGGGVYSSSSSAGSVNITNSNLTKNTAATAGGGIYASSSSSSSVIITNSILVYNAGGTTPHYYNSDTLNNINYSFLSGVDLSKTGVGNFNGSVVNPLFVDTTSGDYHLQVCSPLINAGIIDSIPADIFDVDYDNNTTEVLPLDLDGNPRISFTKVDLGAYEAVAFIGSSRDTANVKVCDSLVSPSGKYVWKNTGTYLDTIPNVGGCDSLIMVNLTVSSSSATITKVVCDRLVSPSGNYIWTTTGTYKDIIPNAANCDSVITVNLTVNSTRSNRTEVVCDSLLSPSGNHVWTTTGVYKDTIPNAANCDSVITVNLTVNSTSANITKVVCGSLVSPSGKYVWKTTGVYMDTIANAASCDSVISVNLTINSAIKTVSVSGKVLTADEPIANFQWVDCNNNYSKIFGATNQSFTPTVNGNYAVILDNGKCTDTSNCIVVNPVGVNAIANPIGVSIYPNPASKEVTITFNELNNYSLQLIDVTGKVIQITKVVSKQTLVDVSNFESGVYFVVVYNKEQKSTFKLVVE